MSNTIRDLSELLSLFADNNSNQITAQDLRDFIVTTDAWRFSGDYNDLENKPELGSISLQDYDNVNITGGTLTNLSLLSTSSFNSGVTLASNAYSNAKVSIRTPVVDFKTVAETNLFTVPSGYMFLIDSMEVLTISISGAANAPNIRFGNTDDPSAYYSESTTLSNAAGARHVIDMPQDGADASTVITFGISSASTAAVHEGVGIVTGYLVKLT